LGKRNSHADARQRWEAEQERLHDCHYVDSKCVVHGSTTTVASELKATRPLCNCRSFHYPHKPEEHDTLPGGFAGDTELRRFQDAAATDWRPAEERQRRPESDEDVIAKVSGEAESTMKSPHGEQLVLIEKWASADSEA
jgi:hypothetical protein